MLEATLGLELLPWGRFQPIRLEDAEHRKCRELSARLALEKREVFWERGRATSLLVDRLNPFGPGYDHELPKQRNVTLKKLIAIVTWNEDAVFNPRPTHRHTSPGMYHVEVEKQVKLSKGVADKEDDTSTQTQEKERGEGSQEVDGGK
ncbi:hypothetical protein SRHO_G00193970 [Serrasalmus rhombeus]